MLNSNQPDLTRDTLREKYRKEVTCTSQLHKSERLCATSLNGISDQLKKNNEVLCTE